MSKSHSYAFQSEPRAVASKRFRQPVALMNDRRVVRGTTTKTVPTVAGVGADRGGSKDPSEQRRARGFIPPTQKSIFDLKPEQEEHIPVSLDAFLVEKEKVVSVVDIQTQTDEFAELPPPAPYVPKKTGIDVGTQVDLDELFDFDLEVGPILDVIVNKTLEQARMEVEEEEELAVIRGERRNYDVMHQAERARIAALEKEQKKKQKKKEKRVERERERVSKELMVYRKVGSVQLIKAVLGELRTRVYGELEASGFFPDMLEEEVKQDFMPWLYDAAAGLATQQDQARKLADALIENALAVAARRHRERKCYIRVVVNVGATTHVGGPLVVARGDTVELIHERISAWLSSRGTSIESLGGPIRLAYGSPPTALDSSDVLLSIPGLDLNQLHVSVELPEGAGANGDGDDE
jgi:hypothetical protein